MYISEKKRRDQLEDPMQNIIEVNIHPVQQAENVLSICKARDSIRLDYQGRKPMGRQLPGCFIILLPWSAGRWHAALSFLLEYCLYYLHKDAEAQGGRKYEDLAIK